MSTRNRWSRIKDFYREHPIAIALTYMPFYLLGFFLVEQLVEPRLYHPQCGGRLDSVL